ncbi:MAG: hypothetical protein ABIW33_02420 [Sphingomicrobium sp.]
MKPSLRFLAIAMLGWGGLRAATLGVLPGASLLRVDPSHASPPPIVPTQFPPIAPIEAAYGPGPDLSLAAIEAPAPAPAMAAYPGQHAQQARAPVSRAYWGGRESPASRFTQLMPVPAAQYFTPVPTLDQWPLSRYVSRSYAPLRQSVVVAQSQSIPVSPGTQKLDRVQLTAWAMLRSQQTGVAGTPSLANGGTLGASQAGSRIAYNFTRQIAATARTTSEVGRRGAEVALGVRIQPARAIPLWVTAERRQRLGSAGSGRNAFALFFESGVYNRPIGWRFAVDSYLQGGIVGRDGFLDGGLTVTRPVMRRVAAGVGVWGGMQPGVARLDVGPRLTLKVRDNIRVHLDWRQRVAGNAKPGSGAAVTLAGDF